MFKKCCISHMFLLIVLVLLAALACGQRTDNLTDRQRSRIRPINENVKIQKTSFDLKTEKLFKLIHQRPENRDIESEPCETPPLVIPDFRGPGLRVSDVKCLEYLWKIRYYDEALLSAALCQNTTRSTGVYSIVTAIAGGVDGIAGEFPHMGAIGWETVNDTWLFMCEGALVSEKYMLTAAHCARLPTPDPRVTDHSPKVVRFGEVDISDKEGIGKSPKDALIHRFIIHPYYKPTNKYYDIALVDFKNELVLTSKMYPSCIWTNQFDQTGPIELTGWNTIESNKSVSAKEFISDSFDVFTRLTLARKISDEDRHQDNNVSNPVLQLAKVNIMSTWTCYHLTRHGRHVGGWRGILFHQLCADRVSAAENETSCQDTGGVLQSRIDIPEYTDWNMHYLIGVRSFNYGCDKKSPSSFGIYTKISTFLDWIEETVWGEESEEE